MPKLASTSLIRGHAEEPNTPYIIQTLRSVVRLQILRTKVENGRKNPVLTHAVFYFVPSVLCICGISFSYLREREMGVIRPFFCPMFNLYEICLQIDMFVNLLIISFAC
jgi:hypothetical protein